MTRAPFFAMIQTPDVLLLRINKPQRYDEL